MTTTTPTTSPSITVGEHEYPLQPIDTPARIAFEEFFRVTALKIILASAGDLSLNARADIAIGLAGLGWHSEPCMKFASTMAGTARLLWSCSTGHDMTFEAFTAAITDDQRSAGERALAGLTWPGQEDPAA